MNVLVEAFVIEEDVPLLVVILQELSDGSRRLVAPTRLQTWCGDAQSGRIDCRWTTHIWKESGKALRSGRHDKLKLSDTLLGMSE